MASIRGSQAGRQIPTTRVAGIAGILAGVALAGEFLFFSLSGFAQASFNDPPAAMAFLRDHGPLMRVAVLFGAVGVALTLIFLTGLAERLRTRTPVMSVATLYFGIAGNVGDGLVALSFWIGIPLFVTLAGQDQTAAKGAWGAFTAITGGYQGFGNLFLGLSLLASGAAIVRQRAFPRPIGGIALVAGIASVASVVSVNAAIGFVVALVLVIVFRVWAGIELYRGETDHTSVVSATAGQTPSAWQS